MDGDGHAKNKDERILSTFCFPFKRKTCLLFLSIEFVSKLLPCGYDIKATTQVILNAWQIGRDSKSYNNPEEYEPERFLSSDIDYKGTRYELIPFGAGGRGCSGIQFAVAVKEIALANLVHKFDWALPGGARGEDLDMTEPTGATVHRKYPLKAVGIPYSC
ncbi:cytochrome P450 71A26-like [Pyrus ussuriensis x Pyrus communis]|uniref:Cytochrome P450 71A26-like n=1 Tax=Pyrus ussuriensis x Pyrus communis TaxID=2448454 RepID=A0A5N5HKQ5_9ROSA|nr:cytochrome P450 71A26-like [Pyrus ussuriensis x Pyrus communis]